MNYSRALVVPVSIALALTGPGAYADGLWPAKGAAEAPKVMNAFQARLSANEHGLHEGVDIPADIQDPLPSENPAENEIQLPIQMQFVRTDGTGTNMYMTFQTGLFHNVMYHSFLHLQNTPGLNEGTWYDAGTTIGYIGGTHYTAPIPDHLHFMASSKMYWYDGSSAATAYAVNPLKQYNFADKYKDPFGVRPEFFDRATPMNPWDSDEDVHQFICDGSYNTTAKTAEQEWIVWGETDLVSEVRDRMGYTNWHPGGAYRLGYWIYAAWTFGGRDVRSAQYPYLLFTFDRAAVEVTAGPTGPTYTSLVDALYDTAHKDKLFVGGTASTNLNYHYVLTNTVSTVGDIYAPDADQHWYTEAKDLGPSIGNGADADPARNAEETWFDDGKYIVHALVWDLVGVTEDLVTAWVENYPPAVRWKSPDGSLYVSRHRNIVIEFSEPMDKIETQEATTLKKKSTGTPVLCDYSWDTTWWTLTLDPVSALENDTEYEVVVSATGTKVAKDLYGGPSHTGAPLDSEFGDETNHDGTGGQEGDSVKWTFTTWDFP